MRRLDGITQWTWIWVNSRSWWWKGKPVILPSFGSQRVGHDWATELNWALLHFEIAYLFWDCMLHYLLTLIPTTSELNSPIPVHFSLLIPRMSTFTLAISCLTTSNLPWFMDLTFQVPMQHCSLQHCTLLLSPVTSTTGYCFCFGSISSFFLELFLHWSPVAYWAPTDLGSSSFSILSFYLFILFMGFSRQLQELVMDREAWPAAIHGVTKSRTQLRDWTELNWYLLLPLEGRNLVYRRHCIASAYCITPNESKSESRSVVFNSLGSHELYSPWNSPGQITGVGCHALLQGIFPTEGLNWGLPYCRRILYQLSHHGSP